MDPADYARLVALATHASLIKSIETSYPTLSMPEQDAILVDALDRIARMRGWSLRREQIQTEEEQGE